MLSTKVFDRCICCCLELCKLEGQSFDLVLAVLLECNVLTNKTLYCCPEVCFLVKEALASPLHMVGPRCGKFKFFLKVINPFKQLFVTCLEVNRLHDFDETLIQRKWISRHFFLVPSFGLHSSELCHFFYDDLPIFLDCCKDLRQTFMSKCPQLCNHTFLDSQPTRQLVNGLIHLARFLFKLEVVVHNEIDLAVEHENGLFALLSEKFNRVV